MEQLNFGFLDLSYDKEKDMLILDWSEDFVPEGKLKEDGTKIIEFAKKHKASRILMDVSIAPQLHRSNQQYNDDVMIPAITDEGIVKGAVVLPKKIFARLSLDTAYEEALSHLNHNTQAKQFENRDEAIKWLMQ
ncbi:hypothetical protein V6R21_25240 [Limibacter armeniacum]|uniref:hypothetical protein n=1 Tax=Limibacter armeniacum TaxID=466084 RepID=UPI002FE5EBAE